MPAEEVEQRRRERAGHGLDLFEVVQDGIAGEAGVDVGQQVRAEDHLPPAGDGETHYATVLGQPRWSNTPIAYTARWRYDIISDPKRLLTPFPFSQGNSTLAGWDVFE